MNARHAWRLWVALLDRREPATALALVRILVAVVELVDFAWIRHLGLVDALWAKPPAGYATWFSGWADQLGLTPAAMWWLAVGALVAMGVGAATRVACVGFVVVSAQLARIAPDSESAIDMLLRVVIPILALSRCNARWSVDAAVARALGRPPPPMIPAWPRYLLLFQLVWVYFSGGHNKSSAAWGPLGGFAALGYALYDPHASRLPASWVAAVFPLTRVATAATIAFEFAAPLYLLALYYAATADRPGRLRAWCNRWRVRWIWLGLGVAFELGIAATLRLGNFPWGMLALYPVLLLPADYRRKTLAPANRASSPS